MALLIWDSQARAILGVEVRLLILSSLLGWIVLSEDWRFKFDEGSVRHLPKNKSDHCPIILSTCGFAPLPMAIKPFRFHAAWLSHEDFDEFVSNNWKGFLPLIPFQVRPRKKLNET